MHDDHTLSFAAAASLSIPQGRRTYVKALLDADGAARIATGTNAYGRWMRLDFEVVQGEYAGRQAAMMLTFDPRDRDFRAAVGTITGVTIRSGRQRPHERHSVGVGTARVPRHARSAAPQRSGNGLHERLPAHRAGVEAALLSHSGVTSTTR